MENVETRVGYKTVSILRDMLSEYIEAYTINGKYYGDSYFINCYSELNSILED